MLIVHDGQMVDMHLHVVLLLHHIVHLILLLLIVLLIFLCLQVAVYLLILVIHLLIDIHLLLISSHLILIHDSLLLSNRHHCYLMFWWILNHHGLRDSMDQIVRPIFLSLMNLKDLFNSKRHLQRTLSVVLILLLDRWLHNIFRTLWSSSDFLLLSLLFLFLYNVFPFSFFNVRFNLQLKLDKFLS